MQHITDLVYNYEGGWIPTDKFSAWVLQWMTQQEADALLLSLESTRLFRLAEIAMTMPIKPERLPHKAWM